jgi:hypothetical protein
VSAVPADTSLEAWDLQTEIYRRMTGAERVAVTYRLNALARETSMAGIRARHPAYSDEELKRALFRIMHGDALTRAVWPDQPLLEP